MGSTEEGVLDCAFGGVEDQGDLAVAQMDAVHIGSDDGTVAHHPRGIARRTARRRPLAEMSVRIVARQQLGRFIVRERLLGLASQPMGGTPADFSHATASSAFATTKPAGL